MYEALCIGGCLDGNYHTEISGSSWRHPIVEPILVATNPFKWSTKLVEVRYQVYVLEIFHSPTKDFLFWVPEGQSPAETMQKLIDYYATRNDE